MFVGERMTRHPLTIAPDVNIQDALLRMNKDRVRRYPVVDKRGKLVGIVSHSDLMNASPSDATTLSVWEANYLLSKIQVKDVMTKELITVGEDTLIEEAARIMATNKIGGLPVVTGGKLVGIITETDVFNIFLEILGVRTHHSRIDLFVEDRPGQLAAITKICADRNKNIINTVQYMDHRKDRHKVILRLEGDEIADDALELEQALLRQYPDAKIRMRESGRYILVQIDNIATDEWRGLDPIDLPERQWRVDQISLKCPPEADH